MNDMEFDANSVAAYDYDLPRELIAQHPLEHRIDARLMLIDRSAQSISHHYVRDLPDLLNAGDILVMNNSKVLQARLVGKRTSTGGRWEGLYLRSGPDNVWEILSKTRGYLTNGETISLRDQDGRESEQLVVVAHLEEGHLAVRPVEETSLEDFLERFGRVPLPPYIRDGQMVDEDVASYQTVYAKTPGSVAAPTAGLHFSTDLIRHLQRRGVGTAGVTLHVGIGTFRPVSVARVEEHKMHTEWCELTDTAANKIERARAQGGRVIAVGTTSARVLESAAKQHASNDATKLSAWTGETNIFIHPPYQFLAINGLMTNFHLPKSTLLMLVSAFAGRDLILRAYHEAIRERYRFYSYGDCMLIV
jgi:S-adenosylmethionine:tRNA ribosyltransferase-isomerase